MTLHTPTTIAIILATAFVLIAAACTLVLISTPAMTGCLRGRRVETG